MYLEHKQEKWFRLEFIFSFFMIFIQIVIYWFLFRRIFADSNVDPVSLALYYAIVNLVSLSMIPAQYVTWKHMEDMNSGRLILRLVRPENYPVVEYLKCTVKFVMQCVVNLLLIFVGIRLLKIEIPLINFFAGTVSLFIGFTILYLIQGTIGCLAAWLKDVLRLRDVFMSLLLILGGKVIPSEYLFGGLKRIIYVTPIPYIYDVPTKILSGNQDFLQIVYQLVWAFIWLGIYAATYKKAIHNIDYGG
jgi:ABC-type uncharacterized transport system permease subunit